MVQEAKVFADKPENLSSDRRKESTVLCKLFFDQVNACCGTNINIHMPKHAHARVHTHIQCVFI